MFGSNVFILMSGSLQSEPLIWTNHQSPVSNHQELITQKSKQEILEAAKIEDIVEDFVNLKRRGVNYIGLCPFHNEKTPSFTVSPSKNICKCFGCGKGGDPVQFLREHENFTFVEALRYIAKKYNIKIEEKELTAEAVAEKQLYESLYLVNQFAKDFYHKQLLETDAGKSIGLSYFKQRGFREATIKKFDLGYAPNAKDELTAAALRTGYNIELLRKLRLTNQYDGDFFRDRVMFTIHNLTGKVIAFAGRTLSKDKKIAKYVNSPETEIYIKNKVLYGAHLAKKSIRKEDECILVEGYTDVISLHQAGIENVVASSGTSLTEGQINLIKRYTPNIKILYDGDAAGIKAALRGLDLVLEQDMNVKVVLLPDGEDPDSYLEKLGTSDFKTFIQEKAEDFILFKTNLLLANAGDDPIKRAQIIQDIVASISKVPDPIKRSVYVKECSRLVDVEEQALFDASNKIIAQTIAKRRQKRRFQKDRAKQTPKGDPSFPTTPPPEFAGQDQLPPELADRIQPVNITAAPDGDTFQEKDIVRILISGGTQVFDEEENITVAEYILSNMEDVLDSFQNAIYGKIVKEYHQALVKKKKIDHQYFLHHSEESIRQIASDMLSTPYEYSPNWEEKLDLPLQTQKKPEENFTKDSISSLREFKKKKIKKMREEIATKLKAAEESGESTNSHKYLKLIMKLDATYNELAKQTNTVVVK